MAISQNIFTGIQLSKKQQGWDNLKPEDQNFHPPVGGLTGKTWMFITPLEVIPVQWEYTPTTLCSKFNTDKHLVIYIENILNSYLQAGTKSYLMQFFCL